MSFRLMLVGVSALGLVACGGGGGGDSSPPPVVTPPVVTPPTTYTPVAVKTGDTYVYATTGNFSDGSTASSSYTDQVAAISSTGNYFKSSYDSKNEISALDLFDKAQGQLTEGECDFSQSLKPVVFPFFVGQTFNQSVVETCPLQQANANQIININITGSVLSYETVTVPAGTFNTLKVQSKVSVSNGNGTAQSLNPFTRDRTCWVDIVSGANVKCDFAVTYNPAVSGTYLSKYSSQLTSTGNASTAAFSLTGKISGEFIPYLYVTPGYVSVLVPKVGQTFELDTTRPVAWSMITGSNTVNLSGGATPIVYNGVNFTISTTGTSLVVSSSAPSKIPSVVNLSFKATLQSDKSKVVTVNVPLNP